MLVYYDEDHIRCDCGSIIKEGSIVVHLATAKHKRYLDSNLKEFKKNTFKDYKNCYCGVTLRYSSMFSHLKSNTHKKKMEYQRVNNGDLKINLN